MILASFGDSWPYGAELEANDVFNYGKLLSNRLQTSEFYNYGNGGASLEDMLIQLKKFVLNHYDSNTKTIGLFFLTNPARSTYKLDHSWHFDDKNFKKYPLQWKQQIKEQYVHFHNYDFFRASMTISAIQYWCKQLNIIDFYFAGWIHYDFEPMVDTTRIWKEGKETCGDWFGLKEHNSEHLTNCSNNKYIKPNYAHPNIEGHKLIADKLEPWILNNIDNNN